MNIKTKEEYLVSVDRELKVIIWDINNNYSNIFVNIMDYKYFINDILMLFIEDKTFIAISSVGSNEYTKIMNIYKDDDFFEIAKSYNLKIYNLSYWYNEKMIVII